MKKFLLVLAAVSFSVFVHAAEECDGVLELHAELDGFSRGFGLGETQMEGAGSIFCMGEGEPVFIRNVSIDIQGAGLGIGVANIEGARLLAGGIGSIATTDAFMGSFGFVRLASAVGPLAAGGGASLYLSPQRGDDQGIAIPVAFNLNVNKGVGLWLGLDVLEVTITDYE